MSNADNCLQWRPQVALFVALAACSEPTSSSGVSRAELVARAAQLDGDPAAALVALPPVLDAEILRRRAELLDRLGRVEEAQAELAQVIALAPDAATLAQRRLLAVSIAARAGSSDAIERVLAAAPITEHPALAHRAAADVPATALATLGMRSAELARAAGLRLEETSGPAAALVVRERWVALAPDDADAWDALARSRIAAGKTDEALAAWDRAIAIAPAQETFRTSPIQALVIAGDLPRARERALALAVDARSTRTVERFVAASAGAAHVDRSLALAMAREARALRPGDGRLAFLEAQRLAEAGDRRAAARAYTVLLVCGARGRPWHRHEVAARLQQLGAAGRAALDEDTRCDAVEPADLATYVDALREVR